MRTELEDHISTLIGQVDKLSSRYEFTRVNAKEELQKLHKKLNLGERPDIKQYEYYNWIKKQTTEQINVLDEIRRRLIIEVEQGGYVEEVLSQFKVKLIHEERDFKRLQKSPLQMNIYEKSYLIWIRHETYNTYINFLEETIKKLNHED